MLPSFRKNTSHEADSSVRCRALHPSIEGRQLSAWFLNKSKTELWAAKSSRQLRWLCLISLKSPNKTSRHCRPRWIISREMSICFRIRILNELTITAKVKPVHTQIHRLNTWLLHLKYPRDYEAGKKSYLAASRPTLKEVLMQHYINGSLHIKTNRTIKP